VGGIVAIVTIGAFIPPKKEFFKAAIIPGIACFVMSWLMGYFVAPLPKDLLGNAFGSGMAGMICGFVSAYVTAKVTVAKMASEKVQTKAASA
jgi:hypothetical protein